MRGIREVQSEIDALTSFSSLCYDKRVRAFINQIRIENAPAVEKLTAELEALKAGKPKPKGRWPENTPAEVIAICESYWKGTSEFHLYRIHCWNDKAIWTSYLSGGYGTMGGWVKSQAGFFLISRTEMNPHLGGNRMKVLVNLEGRVSAKTMLEELAKL